MLYAQRSQVLSLKLFQVITHIWNCFDLLQYSIWSATASTSNKNRVSIILREIFKTELLIYLSESEVNGKQKLQFTF